jgi:hypothetical protein
MSEVDDSQRQTSREAARGEVDDSQRQTSREAARGVGFKKWCGWRGSNPRPLASEANTLSTELQPQTEGWIVSGEFHVTLPSPPGQQKTCGLLTWVVE